MPPRTPVASTYDLLEGHGLCAECNCVCLSYGSNSLPASIFFIHSIMLWNLSLSFALIGVAHKVGVFASNVNIEALFGPYMSLGTEIAEPTDANFSDVVSPRWSEWDPPTWTGAIKPETERDLQRIVSVLFSNLACWRML